MLNEAATRMEISQFDMDFLNTMSAKKTKARSNINLRIYEHTHIYIQGVQNSPSAPYLDLGSLLL